MIPNEMLRIHVINVGHGDSILVEMPDVVVAGRSLPRFGLVDAGGDDGAVKMKTRDYVSAFIRCRLGRDPASAADAEDYSFEFVCLTHPHSDHLHGMMPLLEAFCADAVPAAHRPRQFWDCGFRYNTIGYLGLLAFLRDHPEVKFVRVTSGTELHFGDVEVMVLAPSIDMRNRYDTYGVDVNDASIVLRVALGRGVAILAGDAQFDTWGKVVEEFPRKKHLTYPPKKDGDEEVPDLRDTARPDIAFLSQENQLKCKLLKVSHHGSKNGTSYEYVAKLAPLAFAISCDEDGWYAIKHKDWVGKFPHPITRLIIGEEEKVYNVGSPTIPDAKALGASVGITCREGTLIYSVSGTNVTRKALQDARGGMPTDAVLRQNLQ